MLKVLSADAMASADRYTIENGIPSLVLMERAALGVLKVIKENELDTSKALILCGTGNNAADGAAIARLLCEEGLTPFICLLGDPAKYSDDLNTQLKILSNYEPSFVTDPDPEDYTIIIDAMFGIGLKRDLSGIYQKTVLAVNESGVPVVAVDIPSGLNADTGIICGNAVFADITVTFQYAKTGQLICDGPAVCGDLYVENIGIMPGNAQKGYYCITSDDTDLLPGRDESGNKGTFGKLFVMAGSAQICGAAYLCAASAFKTGIGMVKILSHNANRTALNVLLPEALISAYGQDPIDDAGMKEVLEWADCVLAGPGIGTDEGAVERLRQLLSLNNHPIVLDADALNILSQNENLWELISTDCVITPHVGEMARLSGLSVSEIKADPIGAASELSYKRNVTCILKDAVTITAFPNGEVYINTSGSSALATAGSGDVLAGMTAGMMTRYRQEKELPVAAMAVYLHGTAGESAEELMGAEAVTASDLIGLI